MMDDDMTLVREFAARQSEPAFATLVERHIGLVHSAAMRQAGDPHLALEITQAVFIILARKSASLGPKTVLAAWLYRTTRYAAADVLRARRRRQSREQEAYMQSTLNQPENEAWTQLAPLLDDAMAELGETDRTALVLRYFENKSAREIAAALRMEESTAQKRVTRALEKLRARFAKRGLTLTATVIAAAVAANSVQAAPVGLAMTVTATAAKGAFVGGSTLTLIKGALKLMMWTKAKTAIVVAGFVLLAAGTATIAVNELSKPPVDFQAEGVLDFTVDGKVGQPTEFTVFVKGEKWLIHFPAQTTYSSIDYEETSFDGENVYNYTQFKPAKLPSNSGNTSGGNIKANNIPDLGGSTDRVTPIWLAYGSSYYFMGITGNRMKSFFFVNRPSPELEQGPYMEVDWKRSDKHPNFPTYIYQPKLKERYQVLQFTNFGGLRLPSEFVLEYFGHNRETSNVPVISMHGVLNRISSPATIKDYRPKLDGRTFVADYHFPSNSIVNYMITGKEWISINSSQWQSLLKMYDPRAGDLVWPRNDPKLRGVARP